MKKIVALIVMAVVMSINLPAQERATIDQLFDQAAMQISQTCPQEVEPGIVMAGASYQDATLFINFSIDCQQIGIEEPFTPEVDKLIRLKLNQGLKQSFDPQTISFLKQFGISIGVKLYSSKTDKLLSQYTFDPES